MNGQHPTLFVRLAPVVDRSVALAGYLCLLILIFAASRANIAADSIDYYAILVKLTSAADRPIVRNLHFVEQRSPGYPLAALVTYAVLDAAVEPFVSTETVSTVRAAEPLAPATGLPSTHLLRLGATRSLGARRDRNTCLFPLSHFF